MGCPLRHYSHVPQAVDLSGLLIIVKVSISTMRVCTYISPLEFQGARTNGITAAIPSVPSGSANGGGAVGGSRRKSTTGYHTPFASEPAAAKVRRVSELTVEEDKDRESPKDSNDVETVSNEVESVSAGAGEDGSYQGSAYRVGARKIQWSTDDLIKPTEPSTTTTALTGAGAATTATTGTTATNAAISSEETPRDPKEDIMMCVLDSENGSGSSEKALNLCVIVDFPPKAQGVAIEAVDVQCALGAIAVTIGRV